MPEDTIAIISPSPVRRFISVSILTLLGGILIYLAFTTVAAGMLWQAIVAALGIGAIIAGDRLRRATSLSILMTNDALTDSSGRQICRLEDIAGIDRGAFAFKPANGFLLRLNGKSPRAWAPGLWWRFGRRVGVGGATPSGQGKFMAEAIALRLGQRGSD